LAKSSRNVYLSAAERQQALAIYRNLTNAADRIRSGMNPQAAARAAARKLTSLGFKVDYVAARNAETLLLPKDANEPLRLIAAAWAGKTRLIDNIPV
jgi:pantoate--beta-alanine ligase